VLEDTMTRPNLNITIELDSFASDLKMQVI
jgi:hypothetical protein